MPQQSNWQWCRKCQGLAYAGNPQQGRCPGADGGQHDHTGSWDYVLMHDQTLAGGQNNWRWCTKCQGLAFAGNPGVCPADGGQHDHTGSSDYILSNFPSTNLTVLAGGGGGDLPLTLPVLAADPVNLPNLKCTGDLDVTGYGHFQGDLEATGHIGCSYEDPMSGGVIGGVILSPPNLPDGSITAGGGAARVAIKGVGGGIAAVLGFGSPGVYGADTDKLINLDNKPCGVCGTSDVNCGVYGESNQFDAIQGLSHSPQHAGVSGINDNTGVGVYGESKGNDAVRGISHSQQHAGVSGSNDGGGTGVWAQGNPAGYFNGDIQVTGDIVLLNPAGSDCAEDFEAALVPDTDPGTVMVIDQDEVLRPSQQPYDKRVAGVVSGAGGYRPAITLGRHPSSQQRLPIALVGKVFCKVDASYGEIGVGDLLTTSPTRGHAMKAQDPTKAFGSVIGKALKPLRAGQGLIPILVALQ